MNGEFAEVRATANRADKAAGDALVRASIANTKVNKMRADVVSACSQARQAHSCAYEVKGRLDKVNQKMTGLETRQGQLEIAGGVKPAPGVWIKLGLVAFGMSAAGVAAGMILVAAMGKLL